MPLVYASRNTSRCPLQDSRSGWIRYFLSCRALASPTTCRFIPALSVLPVIRPLPREHPATTRPLPNVYNISGFHSSTPVDESASHRHLPNSQPKPPNPPN